MYGLNFGGELIMLGIACAVGGWAVIEFVLWMFSFVHISVG